MTRGDVVIVAFSYTDGQPGKNRPTADSEKDYGHRT